MAAARGSRFLAFLIVSLIASLVLTASAAPAAYAKIMAAQADGGATITSPSNNKEYDLGNEVTVEARATYQRIDGTKPNYIYLKVTKNGEQVSYLSEGFTSPLGMGLFPTTVTIKFKPEAVGAYLLEVHHDWTYVNGEHVELAYEDFTPDKNDGRTIIVRKSIKNAEVSGLDGMVYTGQALMPVPVVTIDGKTLDPATDFDVTYTKNTDAGEATATIKGKGFYKDSVTAKFNIAQADIAQAIMNGVVDKTYTGSAITQTPAIIWNGRQLVAGTDYDLAHEGNTNAGTATITATGKKNFTGTLSKTFAIGKASIYDVSEPSIANKTYTGSAITQNLNLTFGGKALVEGEANDYTASYANNVNPGTATVTITGKGNFKDSMTRTFSISEPSTPSVEGDTTILEPADGAQFATGSEITFRVRANKFEDAIAPDGHTVLTDMPNYVYVKITRDGSRVDYGAGQISASGNVIRGSVTASTAGVYRIESCWTTWLYTVQGSNLSPTALPYEDFVATDSVTVYVGVNPPGADKNIANATVTGLSDIIEYTGNAITQNPTVKLGGKTLKNGADYYITYESKTYSNDLANNVDIGIVEMTIHGKGSYTGSRASTFIISPKKITANMITLTPASLTYTGALQKPEVTVMHGAIRLKDSVDYTLTNEGGIEPGNYEVSVKGKGNYSLETATKSYTIDKWSIKNAVVTCNPATFTYDGRAKEPPVSAMLDGAVLPPEVYDVSYSDNVNAGTATATITAKADSYYTGSASGPFTISPLSIASSAIGVSLPNDLVYNRQAQTPMPQVMMGEMALASPRDFTVVYDNNVNAGTGAKVTITGAGNFTSSRTETFAIARKPIGDETVTVDAIPDQCYIEGQAATPQVTVKDGNFLLIKDADYGIEYADNVGESESATTTATVTLTGKGNYQGARSDITFRIVGTKEFKESLGGAIEKVRADGFDQYLDVDKAAIQSALDTVGALLNDDAATPEALQNALNALNDAVSAAKLNLAKKELGDAVDAVEAEGMAQYLDADKINVQSALDEATALLNNPAATPEALQQELESLNGVVSTAKAAAAKAAKEKAEAEAYGRAKAEALTMPSAEVVAKTILAQKTDKDPAGSAYLPLQLKSTKQAKTYNVLKWGKVAGASRYEIYGNKCGNANRIAKIATVKTNSFKHAKLKKGTYYKYVVVAVKDTVIGPRAAAVSKMVHVATKGGKAKNTKKLTIKAKVGKKTKKVKSTKVKKGKTIKLKVTPSPKSGVKKHVAVRFETSNAKVATVSAKGVVKGMSPGTCYVYAYAQNGVSAKVEVQTA